MISLTVNIEPLRKVLHAAPAELRRATRNVLNDAARAAQAGIRTQATSRFDVQRPAFLNRSIYIGPEDRATTDHLLARVRLNPDKGDVYGQHDASGPGRKQVRAGRALVIPAREIRTTGGHVQRGLRFGDFKPFATVGGHVSTLRKKGDRLVAKGTKTLRAQVVGRKQSFFVQLHSGPLALMQRLRGQSAPRLLYLLRPAVHLPARLEFHAAASAAVDRSWPTLVDREMANALRRLGLQ